MMDDHLTPHFRASEMRCRCGRSECDAPPMMPSFMAKAEALRVAWDQPLTSTSGSRCAFWNDRIGGAKHSQHLLGNAADFIFSKTSDTKAFAQVAEKCGMMGIGTGIHLVHVDDRAEPARWLYTDR